MKNSSRLHFTILSSGILFLAFGLMAPFHLAAAPLKSATVAEMANEVVIQKEAEKERPAAKQDVVAGKDILRTGRKSRAELEFSDKSIARLGSNTIFSFDPESRQMKLDRGTALIHVPPGLSGAKISTPAATAAIQGDVVAMRVNPQGATQIVALSRDANGPVTVTFNKTGETRTLEAGQMLTINPMDVQLPSPVNINVDVFVQSSPLVKGDSGYKEELPGTAKQEIRQTATAQEKKIQNGEFESSSQAIADAAAPLTIQTSAMESVVVQASTSSRFSGHYVGMFVDLPPAVGTGNLTFDITGGGLLNGQGHNVVNGETFTFNGTINTDGNFFITSNDGKPSSGNVSLAGSSFTGTVNHGNGETSIISGGKQ
jgi:hypothetical protein